MVSNEFRNIFGIGKNASRTFLRTYFNAAFNSKQISSSKDFSKMLLKARNWLWINHLITPSFHVHIPICVTCNYSINFTRPDVVYNSGLYRCTSVTRFVCFSNLAYNIRRAAASEHRNMFNVLPIKMFMILEDFELQFFEF